MTPGWKSHRFRCHADNRKTSNFPDVSVLASRANNAWGFDLNGSSDEKRLTYNRSQDNCRLRPGHYFALPQTVTGLPAGYELRSLGQRKQPEPPSYPRAHLYIISVFEIADGIDDFCVSKEEDPRIHTSPWPFPASEKPPKLGDGFVKGGSSCSVRSIPRDCAVRNIRVIPATFVVLNEQAEKSPQQ